MSARYVVDGRNVIGARPDGWWHDLPGAMRDLVADLDAFAEASGSDITVVFDGRERDEVRAAGSERVEVLFAPHADDRIVAVVRDRGDELTVATSDRELRERVTELGADVVGAGTFRQRLEADG